jgi:prefoldin subunit 5
MKQLLMHMMGLTPRLDDIDDQCAALRRQVARLELEIRELRENQRRDGNWRFRDMSS